MIDVMLEEARMWLDEPPQRKRKLEPPLVSPPLAPIYNDDPYTGSSSSDEEMDLVERERYRKQVVESSGFDVDKGSFRLFNRICPVGRTSGDYLYGRVGLHCYNIEKGTNLQFRRVLKVNVELTSLTDLYITLEAMDPVNNSVYTFQTRVRNAGRRNNASLQLKTIICRVKPHVPGAGDIKVFWDLDAIDDFYKGVIPSLPQDDDVSEGDKLQFYEVTESDLRENEWLYLYAEVALYSEQQFKLSSCMPLKIEKIVVVTKEDVASSMKLKWSNAVFYMSFKTVGGRECKGIIRKTMDGRPGHLSLEAKCLIGNPN